VNADLKKYPHIYDFKLKKPIKIGEDTHEYLSINNYASDSDYSPNGKTALTIILNGDTYDFWKKTKEKNQYAEEKQKLADAIIDALSTQIPEINGHVEVWDVATPLTYERYCANWRGSWMTAMTQGKKMMKNYFIRNRSQSQFGTSFQKNTKIAYRQSMIVLRLRQRKAFTIFLAT